MMYSRSYSRLFITLKQDRNDFCYDLRPAMGRCIIEIRNGSGKAMVFAQGLKPRVLYRVVMVKNKDNENGNNNTIGIDCGLIHIDDRGKGEVSIPFEPDNIFKSNMKIEDINAIFIMVDGMGEIVTPLVGFRDKSFVWKNSFQFFDEKKVEVKKEVEIENKSEIKIEKEIEKKVENQVKEEIREEVQEEVKQEIEQVEDDKKPEAEEIKIEQPEVKQSELEQSKIEEPKENKSIEVEASNIIEQNVEIPQSRTITDFSEFIQNFKQSMLELEHYAFMQQADKPRQIGRGISGIEYIKTHNERFNPFEIKKQSNNINWIKILPCEMTMVNANLWRHLNSPFIISCFKKYNHILLGIENEGGDEVYYIAVPEKYDKTFEIDAKCQGFDEFMTLNGEQPEFGSMGYWIMKVE